MTLVLATTVVGVGTSDCIGGACFVKLNNLTPSRTLERKTQIVETFHSNEIDKSIPIVLDGELISVFPSYKMEDAETFPLEDEIVIVEDVRHIEDIILAKASLPNSEVFCDEQKLPVYEKETNIYICV